MQNTTTQVSATTSALVIRTGHKKATKAPAPAPQVRPEALVEHALRIAIDDYKTEIGKLRTTPAPAVASLDIDKMAIAVVKNMTANEFAGTRFEGLPALPDGLVLNNGKPATKSTDHHPVIASTKQDPRKPDVIQAFPAHLRPAVSALASTLALLSKDELAEVSQKGDWRSRKLLRMISELSY